MLWSSSYNRVNVPLGLECSTTSILGVIPRCAFEAREVVKLPTPDVRARG